MANTLFSAAITASITSLNTDGLTHDQWADAATFCARSFAALGINDPAVRSAAALGGLVRSHPAPASPTSPVVAAFAAAGTAIMAPSMGDAARAEGRTALRFTTHAATLNSHGLPLVLLAAVERHLMGSPPESVAESSQSALENWRIAIATVGRSNPDLSAHLSVAIAVNQRALLRHSRELLSDIETNPNIAGSPDRLLEGIEASIDAWSRAADRWYDNSLGTAPQDAHQSATRLLSLAATDLATALTQKSSPSAELEALIRTGFGGNLIASIVTTDPAHLGNSVVAPAAQRLELIADHFTDHRFGPPFRNRITSPAPHQPPSVLHAPTAVRPVPQQPPANVTEPPPRTDLDVEVQRLTREQENDLAQRRDVGVLAQACLDGDPTARNLTTAATGHELRLLAADGRAAVAQLIASMIPTMVSTNRWIPRHERSDAVQNAAVDVAKAAMRWDPTKGARWLTFAWNTSQWASTNSRKAIDVRPLPHEFDLDTLGTPLHNGEPDPEQRLLQNLERSEERHLLHKIRRLDAGQIRPDLLAVVVRYHGLDGDPPRNFTQIAKDRDSSASTVTRHYYEAIEVLRGLFPATPTTPPPAAPKPWRRPEHAQRHPISAPRR